MSEPVAGIALAAVIAGLAFSTFLTRTSFLLAGSRLRLNPRIEVALRHAPVCTLSAIIVPDVLLHGAATGPDLPLARLIGALAACLWLCGSRNILGCLSSGMLAYSVARVLL